MKRFGLFVLPLTVAVALLIACAAPTPTPLKTPTPAPTPTPTPSPTPTKTPTPTPAWTPPKLVTIVSTATATVPYAHAMAIFSSVTDATHVDFRIIPGATTMARLTALRAGEGKLMHAIGPDAWTAWRGMFEFDVKGWGPQPLRTLWLGGWNAIAFAVRGNSGIKTIADLRGKRVTYYPGYEVLNITNEAYLAFAGLTWKDVVRTNVGGYAPGVTAVNEGAADAAYTGPNSAPAIELAASPSGVRYLDMPHADTEGWKRLNAICPFMIPGKEDTAPGISKEKPIEAAVHSYASYAYQDMDENLAYWLTKQIHENYNAYKAKHVLLPRYTIERATDPVALAAEAPYHPGSVKYFKEIGRWTPALEKVQAEMLAKEKQTRADWEKAHPGW